MKRGRIVLFLLLLLIFLFSFSVLAETITLEGKTIDKNLLLEPDDNGAFSLTYVESEASELGQGQQIVLLVVKGIVTEPNGLIISAANIRYIDQTTSDVTKVEFLNFIPSSVPNCTVLLGGINGGPKIVGYIEAQPVSVSGKMNFENKANNLKTTVKLVDLFDESLETSVESDILGNFYFTRVIPSDYVLTATIQSYTTYTKTRLEVGEHDVIDIVGTLYPGDINANGKVELIDLNQILTYYNQELDSHPADINKNGKVELSDLNSILSYYNREAIIE